MNYYLAIGGQHAGPFAREQLLAAGLTPQTLVWTEGMPQWTRADAVPELAGLFQYGSSSSSQPPPMNPNYGQPNYGAAMPPYGTPAYAMPSDISGKKIAAGICGVLLGGLGIHKFILGFTGAGLTMLLISVLSIGLLSPIMHIIGIIEGIMYLSKSDAEFYQTYIVARKTWF